MGNRKICAECLTVDGVLYDYSKYMFYAVSADGRVVRIRHYNDLIKTGASGRSGRRIGDRAAVPFPRNFPLSDPVLDPHETRVLVISKEDAARYESPASLFAAFAAVLVPLVARDDLKEEVARILSRDYADYIGADDDHKHFVSLLEEDIDIELAADLGVPDLRHSPGNQAKTLPPPPLGKVGSTRDARRAKVSEFFAHATVTAEGGLARERSDLESLRLLVQSSTASRSHYSGPNKDDAKRRALLRKLTKSSPNDIMELVYALRHKDGRRTSAITLAVDALVCGHPKGRTLLEKALLRPDDPALALSYYLSTYPPAAGKSGKSLPSALKKALATAAVKLYTDQSAAKFDKTRTIAANDRSVKVKPVSFADVLALTGAKAAPGSEQSRLFDDLRNGTYTTPLRRLRKDLLDRSPAEREEMLKEEARKSVKSLAEARSLSSCATAKGPTPEYRRPNMTDLQMRGMGDLSLDFLVSLFPVDNDRLREARSNVRKAEEDLRFLDANSGARKKDRRLRTRLRDARIKVDKDDLYDCEAEILAEKELRLYRGSSEYAEYRETRLKLVANLNLAKREKARADMMPGRIPKEVFEVAVPSMSVSQLLLNLGVVERAGVDEEVYKYIEWALENNPSIRLPDVLRSVRGLSVNSLRSNPPVSRPDSADDTPGMGGGYAAQSPILRPWIEATSSRWEDSFVRIIDSKASQMLPNLHGKKALVLVDGSGSMLTEVSGRTGDNRQSDYSSLSNAEVASFAASVIASQGGAASEVVVYSTLESSARVPVAGLNALSGTRRIVSGITGGGTATWEVLEHYYKDHDFVVILTDEQSSDTLRPDSLLHNVPVLTVNFAGHSASVSSSPKHAVVSGWSESVFRAVNNMAARDSDTPVVSNS